MCGLLAATGAAGRPESFFRRQDQGSYAVRWGIAASPEERFSYGDFVRAALAAGRTGNGVFAARVMRGTLGEILGGLGTLYPDLAGDDGALLERALGRLRFVYLRRDDVVAQAVSLLRAEQTSLWHAPVTGGRAEPAGEPRYDAGELRRRVREIEQDNAAWQQWFASRGVAPWPVTYEELAADPAGITRGVLDFLGIDLPPGQELTAPCRRLADDLTTEWIARYRAEPCPASSPGPRA